MTERFIIDDCGTLIDMQTRNTYDYVSDVCGLLNELTEENEQSKMMIATLRNIVLENEDLEKENQYIKNTIKEAYNNERTHIGKNVLKQLIEAIQ